MKLLNKTAISFIIISFCLSTSGAIGSDLYKWIDEKGFIHYSDQLPDRDDGLNKIFLKNAVKDGPPAGSPELPFSFAADCTFIIKGTQNLGTGFFISSNGYAVTCRHVVEDDENHMAILHNRKEFAIGVIATSEKYDIALILVTTPQKTPYISFGDPLSMTPGESVYAIGSSTGLLSTVTYGVFSGIRKKIPDNNMVIQFSAPLGPGNSGGPLIDKEGKAIGVVSWKLVANKGMPVSGIGFAVPMEYLIEEYKSYME